MLFVIDVEYKLETLAIQQLQVKLKMSVVLEKFSNMHTKAIAALNVRMFIAALNVRSSKQAKCPSTGICIKCGSHTMKYCVITENA